MPWYSALAIYLLFWVLCLFLVLPWGVRTVEEEGGKVGAGHAPSAPARLLMRKKLLAATLMAAVIFALFWLNWELDWVTRADLERLHPFLR